MSHYEAIIEGRRRKITGMDAEGNYFLDGGEKLLLKPFEPDSFMALKLKQVSKLTFTGGDWLLDGEDVKGRWLDPLIKAGGKEGMTSEAHTEMQTVGWLRQALDGLAPEDRITIKGVAWFNERFEKLDEEKPEDCKERENFLNAIHGGGFEIHPMPSAQEFRPVLLSDFGVIMEPARRQRAEADRTKPKGRRTPKPVARFESDFAIVVIPAKKNGKDLNLNLEPELRKLVKEIIDSGGKLSRKDAIQRFVTKHGKANSENYQPEKLLRSQTAKAIIKAGLLGTDKTRTSVFWAKERVD